MPDFFDIGFFQALVSNLLAVLVGAGLGVPLGLWLDRRSQSTARSVAEAAEEKARRVAEGQVLAAVRDAVAHNRELLRQANEHLKPGSGYNVIFFNVDPKSIDLLMPQLVERSERFELIGRINNFRYQLEHITRKIDTQYELVYGSAAREGDHQTQRRDEIVRSLLTHLPWIQGEADEINGLIESAMKDIDYVKLPGTQPSPIR